MHIKTIVTHWGTRCYAWDVVNEALNDDGTLRESIFYNVTGESYIPLAYKWANEAAPASVKLYYNDYNNEYPGPKSTAAQELVKTIQAFPGTRIDGVGLQSHFTLGGTPGYTGLVSNMQAFTALGVVVAQTELDIRMELNVTDAKLQQQKQDYLTSVRACVDVEGCVGTTVWDFDDKVRVSLSSQHPSFHLAQN